MSSAYKQEQLEAIKHDGSNLLVSASAGSGKTFVIIERLIDIIKSGKANIDSILAVTFTEDAASEMKEKLKKALVKSVEEGQSNLAPMLSQVNMADICTLHAFCGRLIRKYFFEVGVSPDFTIIDQHASKEIKEESINKVFQEFYKSNDNDFLALVDKVSENRQDTKLKEIILELFDFFGVEANPIEYAKSFISDNPSGFDNLLNTYYSYLEDELYPIKSILYENVRRLNNLNLPMGISFAEEILAEIEDLLSSDIYAVKKYEGVKVRITFERKLSEEALVIKEELTDIRDRIFKLVNEFSSHLTDREQDYNRYLSTLQDAKLLVNIVERFTEVYSKAKREENFLDFADLEHYALRILENSQIKSAIREKYKYVFADEYQDINGVQEALISSISNGNLFMVGDVKQSIYGFRGCKPEIFTEKLNNKEDKSQKTIFLNYNFRSANAVIELVNKIFLYSMTEEHFGVPYHKSMLVSGGLFEKEAVGRTQIHLLEKKQANKRPEESPRIYDILEEIKIGQQEESDNVSALVADIIESELHKKYYDTKSKTYKYVTFGDICILTRSRENAYVTQLVSGLVRRGVPVVSEVKQSICAIPQIQTIINVLKLIDNFTGDIPLACTLKSAVGNFTDEQLAQLVLYYKTHVKEKRGSFYDAYCYCLNNMQGELAEKLRNFDNFFNSMRILADFSGAHDILNKIISHCGLDAELLAEHRGEFKYACLKKFISASVVGERKLTVREFLNLVENNSDAFNISSNADEENVRVMTMHASKGLEFPVVIICGTEIKMRTEDNRHCLFKDRTHGFALKYYDMKNRTASETILRGIIKQKSIKDSIKEELRLFYVATTRATYSMHLIYEGDEKSKRNRAEQATCFWDYIPSELPVTIHSRDELGFRFIQRDAKQVIISSPEKDKVDEIKQNLDYAYPFIEDTKLPLKTSFSEELSKDNFEKIQFIQIEDGKTDIQKGTIAHKVMELVDFASAESLQSQTIAMVEQGKISSEELSQIDLDRIDNAIKNPQLSFLKDCTLYREKGFLAMIDGNIVLSTNSKQKVLVQGQIDLLAVKSNKGYIVDYKYSALTKDSLKIKYKKQLDIYKNAVQNALGITVVEQYILNIFTGDVVKID